MTKFSLCGGDVAGMDISGELFDPRVSFLDVPAQSRTQRPRGIAQPVVTNHAVFIGIGGCARLQLPHLRERLLRPRTHRSQEIVSEPHPTDVDGKTDFAVADKILLEALPQRVHQRELTIEMTIVE